MKFTVAISAILTLTLSSASAQTAVTLQNFTGGVTYTDANPSNSPSNTTWYGVSNDGGKSKAAADTLDGSPAMRVYIRGNGFEGGRNGVYRVFANAIPTTGSWHINAKIRIRENSTPLYTGGPTGVNTVHNLQMGVIVNGAHRGDSDLTAAATIFSQVPTGYLTPADDSAKPTVNLRTQNFTAGPADRLLIVFSTDVQSGAYSQNSDSAWYLTDYLVDEIVLEDASLPVSISAWSLD